MDEGEEVRVSATARVGERKSGRVILNTRELAEQIHLPTLSFLVSSPFLPPSCASRSSSLSPLICFLSRLLLP